MNLQKACKMLGEAGCYFLSILKAFGEEMQALKWYGLALDAGYIRPDCEVLAAGKVAEMVSGEVWTVLKPGPDYIARPGEVEILRYEVDKGALGKETLYTHFVLGDGAGRVAWDPWTYSQTVENGKLAGKRILRKV